MKILITGATGLIGKKLSFLLIGKGFSINYLTTSKAKIQKYSAFNGYYWNIKEGQIDEKCIDGVEAIIHLAGANIAKRWTKTYKNEIINSRILSSNLIYNLLKKHPHSVKQIISASGTAIYPESFSKVYDESSIEKDKSFLGNVVEQWEESVNKFEELNIKVSILRTGIVLDKYDGALPQMAKPVKMFFAATIGTGKQMQSWIHIDDLVQMYYFVLQNHLEGVFNAVSPNPISNFELTKAIAKTLHKPFFLPNIPKSLLEIILGEMSFLLLSSKNLSSHKIEKKGFKFNFPSILPALEDIYK